MNLKRVDVLIDITLFIIGLYYLVLLLAIVLDSKDDSTNATNNSLISCQSPHYSTFSLFQHLDLVVSI